MRNEIALRIQNNTPLSQKISLMGGLQDPNNNANAKALITWSFNSFGGAARVEIQVKTENQTTFTTYSAPLSSPSIGSVINALNSMRVGYFSGNQNSIYTFSDYYQYRNLALTAADYNFDDFMMKAKDFFDPSDSFLSSTGFDFISFYRETFFDALYKVQGVMDAYFLYGMGVFYPISGGQISADLSQIQLISIAPKPLSQQPMTIYNNGDTVSVSGYGTIPTDNSTNVILFSPSGEFLEIEVLYVEGIPYYVSNFNSDYWDLASIVTGSIDAKTTKLYNGGYIASQASMSGLTINNSIGGAHDTIFYGDGRLFPNISSTSISYIELLNEFATYSGTTTANDFNIGFLPIASNVKLSGYGTVSSPVNFDPSLSNLGFNLTSFELSNMAINVISFRFNDYFFDKVDLLSASYLKLTSPNYDSQFEDLVTPLDLGNFKILTINMGLSNFPAIEKVGNQNVSLLQYQLVSLDLTLNKFPSSVVNKILIDIDTYVSNLILLGYTILAFPSLDINISGQTPAAPPFGAGLLAKNNLIANGFTITTD